MKTLTFVALMGALAAGGCQFERYRSQPLGEVGYARAFAAGKMVMSQYFSIASADSETGKIISRPEPVKAPRDRLLGSSPARQVATLRIRQKGDEIFADLRVEIQRQDASAIRHMQPVTVDTELPSRTPAQETAPLTAEQNQAWQTTGRNESLERTILADLLNSLAPEKLE